jgi:osmotically inducible protein OsmC
VETTAKVSIEVGDAGPTITKISLSTVVDADLGAEEIDRLAQEAKANCPVSKALAAVESITLKVTKA